MLARKALLISTLLVFCGTGFGQAAGNPASLAGGWKGTWTKEGDPLPVTMSFVERGSAYSGKFSSDALQVTDIPVREISDKDGQVQFQVNGDISTPVFNGTVHGETLSGTFTDGTSHGTFELTRFRLQATPIHTRDVTFHDEDTKLSGTLLLPTTTGKHPAIIFLHGSGAEGRWANHYLAQRFAERGVVALIYDKRGVGQSTGDWHTAGFDALADDAVAGIRFLQSQPEVDRARVGVYGHSQGGTFAPLVAVRAGNLSFVIASAAGGIDPAAVETYSVENYVGVEKLSPPERADADSYIRELVDVAYRGKSHAELNAMAHKFADRGWYFDPPPPNDSYWLISRQIATFNPAQYWRQIHAPVLLVYGAHDQRVPPRESISAIEAALKSGGNTKLTVKLYPDADHTFSLVDQKGGWPKHEPDYADTLVNWALEQK